jgi:hypothetical protein
MIYKFMVHFLAYFLKKCALFSKCGLKINLLFLPQSKNHTFLQAVFMAFEAIKPRIVLKTSLFEYTTLNPTLYFKNKYIYFDMNLKSEGGVKKN